MGRSRGPGWVPSPSLSLSRNRLGPSCAKSVVGSTNAAECGHSTGSQVTNRIQLIGLLSDLARAGPIVRQSPAYGYWSLVDRIQQVTIKTCKHCGAICLGNQFDLSKLTPLLRLRLAVTPFPPHTHLPLFSSVCPTPSPPSAAARWASPSSQASSSTCQPSPPTSRQRRRTPCPPSTPRPFAPAPAGPSFATAADPVSQASPGPSAGGCGAVGTPGRLLMLGGLVAQDHRDGQVGGLGREA